MQRATFVVGQVVVFVVGDEVDDGPLGQSRRLVQDEATLMDASSQRAHAATARLRRRPAKYSGHVPQVVDLLEPAPDSVPTGRWPGRQIRWHTRQARDEASDRY
jgi:hypothetical protein